MGGLNWPWSEPTLPQGRVNWHSADFVYGRRKIWRLWLAASFFIPWHPNRWLLIMQEEIVGAKLRWEDLSDGNFAAAWLNAKLTVNAVVGTKERLEVPSGPPAESERFKLNMLKMIGNEGPSWNGVVPRIEAAVRRGVPREFAIRSLFPLFEPGPERDPYRRADYMSYKRWRLVDGKMVEEEESAAN